MLEHIPAHKDKPAHQHMDFVYLARPVQLRENLNGFCWVNYEELQDLELFPDVQEILRLLLKENGLNRLQPEWLFNPLS